MKSPSTYQNDRIGKMKLYCEFGVAEYWLVDPNNKAVEVYSLENNVYTMTSIAVETGEVVSKNLIGRCPILIDIALSGRLDSNRKQSDNCLAYFKLKALKGRNRLG